MAQNKELDAVKERIKKALARTEGRGCSEAEAQTAMDMVGRLLEQYDLTMEDIDVREQRCIQSDVDSGSMKNGATGKMAVAVAGACGVRVWASGGGKTRGTPNKKIHFFGFEPDVQLAVFLTELLRDSVGTERDKYMRQFDDRLERGKKKSMRVSFEYGFVTRINSRLRQMEADRRAAALARGSDSRALVVVKEKMVEEEFNKMGMRLTSTKSYYQRRNVGESYRAGDAAGEKVNLGRPVDGGGRNQLYLE